MPLDYLRIEKALRYLDDHADEQPSLAAVAAHVGLSEPHFHRLFRRWAGVTPKQFLQCLTLERAKGLLREEGRPVLDAALGAGLSGPGRLHDLFVALEGMTPGDYRREGAGLTVRWGAHGSPFGECLLAATERGVCALRFVDGEGGRFADGFGPQAELEAELAGLRREWPLSRFVRDQAATGRLARAIFGEAGGPRLNGRGILTDVSDRPDDSDTFGKAGAGSGPRGEGLGAGAGAPIRLLVKGTNFQVNVWRALLRIPEGRVTTYAALAEAVGRPGAARAVGQAVGRNPVAWLIPCHRVITSLGGVGGYRWGTLRKQAMLAREAAKAR